MRALQCQTLGKPSDLKLVTALFVLLTLLSMAARKKRASVGRKKVGTATA